MCAVQRQMASNCAPQLLQEAHAVCSVSVPSRTQRQHSDEVDQSSGKCHSEWGMSDLPFHTLSFPHHSLAQPPTHPHQTTLTQTCSRFSNTDHYLTKLHTDTPTDARCARTRRRSRASSWRSAARSTSSWRRPAYDDSKKPPASASCGMPSRTPTLNWARTCRRRMCTTSRRFSIPLCTSDQQQQFCSSAT